MKIETRKSLDGTLIYLYSKTINLKNKFKRDNQNKVLKTIDELVKLFSKNGKFENTFYLWDRSEPNVLVLVKRSEIELDTNKVDYETSKFELFENTLHSMLKKF